MARKIIQIATGNGRPLLGGNNPGMVPVIPASGVMLYALADDGSVWQLNRASGRDDQRWTAVPDIPQN